MKLAAVIAVTAGLGPAPPSVPALQASAEQFWAARNVVGCTQGIRGGIDTVAGRAGHGGACEFTISAQTVDLAANAWEGRRYYRGMMCAVVYHEVGHALGLEHADTGLMNAAITAHPEWWPQECRRTRRATAPVR